MAINKTIMSKINYVQLHLMFQRFQIDDNRLNFKNITVFKSINKYKKTSKSHKTTKLTFILKLRKIYKR